MGCDIHMVLEAKRSDGKWIGMHAFPYINSSMITGHDFNKAVVDAPNQTRPMYMGWKADSRNYAFFGELAGVRCESQLGNRPLGMPDDASELTALMYEPWAMDAHATSFMPVRLAAACHLLASEEVTVADVVAERLENNLNSVVSTQILKRCRELFGVEGNDDDLANYRIVFWFDN